MQFIPWRVKRFVSDHFPLAYHLMANAGFGGNDAGHWDAQLARSWEDRSWPTKTQMIASLTSPDEAILDIGCGTGSILRDLKKLGYTDLHGVEISEYAVDRLRTEGLTMWRSRLPQLPMVEEKFDVVIASQVLEHVIRRGRFMREIVRVLQPAGRVFIFVPNDCLGPIDEREHVIKYNRKSLGDFLSRYLDVISIDVMTDANYPMSILFAQLKNIAPIAPALT